jgi:signal transduction histidine kinase
MTAALPDGHVAHAPRTQAAPRKDAWATGPVRWDAYYAAVFGAVLIIVWVTSGPPARWIATAAILAMLPWYVLVGRPVWTRGADSRGRAAVYIAGLFLLFAAAQSQDPSAWYLAFALCPQFFYVISPRPAMWAASGINGLAWLLLVYRERSLAAAAISLATAAAGTGFAVAYGGWITRIIDQSRERAEIIEQLEATRGELAAANHEAGILAEDIHDTIAQGFSSVIMLIQAAEAELGSSPDEARRHLRLAADTARENLADARAVVAALAPAQLDGGKLDDALRRLAGQAAGLGAATAVDVSGSPRPLDMAAEVMLLRVSQEALANIRKHSGARQARMRLSYGSASVCLEISDDGKGFDPDTANGGYGLRGMRARVSEAGGRLVVRSAPGEGTSVSVEVPA